VARPGCEDRVRNDIGKMPAPVMRMTAQKVCTDRTHRDDESAEPHQVAAPPAEEGDEERIVRVPAAAVVVLEERVGSLTLVRVLAVERLGEDADLAWRAWGAGMRRRVKAVLSRHEHGTCRKHDSRVVQDIRVIELDEILNRLLHEGMVLLGKHKVVGNADRDGARQNDGVDKQWVDALETADVEVEINTAVVVEDKVADCVCALDRVLVCVEGGQKPGVVGCQEVAGFYVCPEHVFAVHAGSASIAGVRETDVLIRHQVSTSLADRSPPIPKVFVPPSLMKDTRYPLWS